MTKSHRWTRIGIGLLMAGIFLGGWGAPARAGGNWIEWEREFYAPGETVIGRLGGIFPALAPEQSFFAYLSDNADNWRYEPPLPDDAVLLSEVEPTGAHTARMEFTLPDVAPGQYYVHTCNDPCTRAVGVDVTWINVVRTPVEASTRERLETIKFRLGALKNRFSQVKRTGQANDDSIVELRQSVKDLDRQVSHLQTVVEHLQDREVAPPVTGKNDLSAPLLILVAAMVGVAVFRRRTAA